MPHFDEAARQVLICGLALLREGLFFEAHECFESAWRNAHDRERTLMHALAQLSASYHQLALGRARAALRTWSKACEKLAAVGALSRDYQRDVEDFWARLGVGSAPPRFIRPEHLPPREHWPRPEYLLCNEEIEAGWRKA